MRILNLLPRLATPPVDGGAIGVYYPMKSISEMGHEVCTIAMVSNRHPQDLEMSRAYSECYTIDGKFPEPSFGTAVRNFFSRKPYNLSLRFAKPEFHTLIKKVARDAPKPDIIQLDWIYMAEYLKTIRKCFPGVPVVLRQHNAEHVIFRRLAENESNIFKRIYLFAQARKMYRYERRMMRKMDYYTTVTDTDLAIFKKMAPSVPGKTIQAGVHTEHFERPNSMPREKSFLILGSLSWAPYAQSVEWFLDKVWKKFSKDNPGVGLYIVGSNPPLPIQKWTGTMGVHVTGFVEDVLPLLHRCSAMVVPLLSGSGMRIKIVESMAASLPVISTSIGIEGIKAEKDIHALVADRPEHLREHMQRILEDSSLHGELVKNGKDLVKRDYEWHSIAEQCIDVYQSLLQKS